MSTAGKEYYNSRSKLSINSVKFEDEEEAIKVLKERKITRIPISRWLEDLEYDTKKNIWYTKIRDKERVLHDFSLQQILAHINSSGAINMLKTLQDVDDRVSSRCCKNQNYIRRKQRKIETNKEYDINKNTCQNCGKHKSDIPRNNYQMEAIEDIFQNNWRELRDKSTRTSAVYGVQATDILGSSIRAFPTEGKTKSGKDKGYYYLPDWRAMELAKNIIPKSAEFIGARISPVSTEFNYSLDTKTFKGEEYKLGVSVSNSEFKFKSYTINALIYQQICSNGLMIIIGRAVERIAHNKEELKFNLNVKVSFKRIISKLDVSWKQYINPLKTYSKKLCEDWEKFLELNFLKFKSKKELKEIVKIAEDWEYDTTPRGIMQALTNFSSNKATEQRRQYINVKANNFLVNISSIVNQLDNEILV